MDIFDKLDISKTPLGKFADEDNGYIMFPKLEGEISPRMKWNGREVLVWSLNTYLGLLVGLHIFVSSHDDVWVLL